MILTLTPNPALDVTYEVDTAVIHHEHRVGRVHASPGGKGVNVARVLVQLGRDTTCAGPLGGATGEELRILLSAAAGAAEGTAEGAGEASPAPAAPPTARLRQAWTAISGASRRTVTVVDPGGATGFNEPGPQLDAADLTALHEDLEAQLGGASPSPEAVAISGSLPPGMSPDHLAALISRCRDHDRPVAVDTSGPALRAAARAGATLVKPNAHEALAATGAATPLEAAALLAADGARFVVCSLGADGMLALERTAPERTDSGLRAWRAALPEPISGNPTGAGDSVVAVLCARLLVDQVPLPDALREAVAVSASAVTRPVAGQIDPGLAREFSPTVTVQEIPCP